MSADLAGILQGVLGGDTMEQFGQELGTDSATVQNAVSMALPALLGALSRNAASADGASALENALGQHDGSVLGDLAAIITGGGGAGASILGHVLGARQGSVQAGISNATGMDGASVARLLAMLAPIVMGALGRSRQQGGADFGLSDVLSGAAANTRQAAPGGGSFIEQMLDANGDGSIIDDVARGLLGGLFGGKDRTGH
jgi:hypothetical protein